MYEVLQERVAGAKGVAHTAIEGAGHFLQEDKGELAAEKMLEFIRGT